jgi:FixJ family two-component response regulator
LPVIVITAHGDVAAARQAFLADAADFIEKPFDGKQLLGAIENALSGFRALDTAQARAAFTKPTLGQLSIREREVMTLMVKGLHNRRIAETLGISPRTVEVHKARVMEKLGAQNIVDLVRLVDKGLT